MGGGGRGSRLCSQMGNTALLIAAGNGHIEVMQLLLDKKLEKKVDVNKRNAVRLTHDFKHVPPHSSPATDAGTKFRAQNSGIFVT